MPSSASVLVFAALAALARSHGVLLNAQGIAGSPASVGFQVDPKLARNCTSINPCQQDTTIIRDAEIAANVVNECGRTELGGNIDIGENTEAAIAAKAVTQVKASTKVQITIHQVNADGAGPYACDLIEAGNNGQVTQNLTVTNNVPGTNGFSQAKTQDFNITVQMPDSFKCTGASTGNVCTVRCRNNAQAGPFGGCIPVEQVDTTPNQNKAANIPTALSLAQVMAQVASDKNDFPSAVKAIQDMGTPENMKAASIADKMSGNRLISGNSAPATGLTASTASSAQGNSPALPLTGRSIKYANRRRFVKSGEAFKEGENAGN